MITTDQLDSLVRRYWHFEKLPGDSNSELSADDFYALKHLEKHTSYDAKEKRFTVRHIFREEPTLLNNSRQAMGQFLSMERKLNRPGMEEDCSLYTEHFKDGIEKGIFVEVSDEERTSIDDLSNNQVHFLIHFPVFRKGHASTPCRPVLSPSAPTPSAEDENCHSSTGYRRGKMTGPKLNSFVSKGPNYMNSIPELTLAFRRGKYVTMADVKQQFHQLKIHPEDQRWGYFYFRDPKEPEAKIKVYKIARTYFGLACAPAQAAFCMRKIAQMQKDKHPEDVVIQDAAQILIDANYVDDYLWSFNDEDYGIQIIEKMQQILAEGSFTLTKFVSNNQKC